MAEIIAAALCGLAVGFVVGRRNRADPDVGAEAAAVMASLNVDAGPMERPPKREPETFTCSPHQWKIPDPQDDGLVCTKCGRYVEWSEVERKPYMLDSIVKAMQKRRGDDYTRRFVAGIERASDGAISFDVTD